MPVTPKTQGRARVAPIPQAFQQLDSRGAFGEDIAQARFKAGQQLQQSARDVAGVATEVLEADQRISDRQDAVQRVREIGALRNTISQMVTQEQAGTNFGDDNAVTKFRQSVDEAIDKAVAAHSPRRKENIPAFMEAAESLRAQYHGVAIDEGVKAAHQNLSTGFTTRLTQLQEAVELRPEIYNDALAEIQLEIARDYAPHWSPQQEQAAHLQARDSFAEAVVNKHLANGAIEKARDFLSSAGVAGELSNKVSTQLRLKVTIQEAQQVKAEREMAAKVALWNKAFPGQAMTPQVFLALNGITMPATKLTAGDMIKALETAIGAENVTDEQRAEIVMRMAGGGGFGSQDRQPTQRETLRRYLAQNVDAYRTGVMSSSEKREFELAAADWARVNPVTQERSEMPSWLQEAIINGGGDPNEFGRVVQENDERVARVMRGQPAQLPDLSHIQIEGGRLEVGGGASLDSASSDEIAGDVSPEQATRQLQEAVTPIMESWGQQADERQRTGQSLFEMPADNIPPIYEMTALLTGPVAIAGPKLARNVPIFGQLFARSPQMTQAQSYLRGFREDIIKTFQNTPKLIGVERQDIKEETLEALDPRFLDTPDNMRSRLAGLADFVDARRADLLSARDKNPSADGQRAIANALSSIDNISARLGVPPRVRSADHYRQLILNQVLVVGDVYLGSNLREHTVTQADLNWASGENR